MSERPEDRGLLAEAADMIREAVPEAVGMELMSTDQGQYGFMVADVMLPGGGSLAERDPALLDRLQSATWDLLVGVGWWGAVGEDDNGFGRIDFCERCRRRPVVDRDAGLCDQCSAHNDDRVVV